jgi:hypothetical protein
MNKIFCKSNIGQTFTVDGMPLTPEGEMHDYTVSLRRHINEGSAVAVEQAADLDTSKSYRKGAGK